MSLAELKGLEHLDLSCAYGRRACFGLALKVFISHMITPRCGLCLRSALFASECAALRVAWDDVTACSGGIALGD
eukprot:4583675-Pleurochrysis_carterae.AAC.1